MKRKINLAVIFGGRSGEHEVSLKSASQVMASLNKEKYNIVPIAITKKGQWLIGKRGSQYLELNLPSAGDEGGISVEQSQALVKMDKNKEGLINYIIADEEQQKIDLVLPIGHGSYIEDGKLQGMLEMLDLPYVFSGTLAHALAMNKSKAKIIVKNAGVPVLPEILINSSKKYDLAEIISRLNLPIVIKPMELGSSVGLTIAKNKEELLSGINKAFLFGQEVMLECFAKGRELTVTILGNNPPQVLPITEIIPLISDFYDYQAKYKDGGSRHVCPAQIPESVSRTAGNYALTAFKAIGCRDLARVDFIWDEKNNKIYFLEINTIPGMTATSLSPESARVAGINFTEFLDKLINEALNRMSK